MSTYRNSFWEKTTFLAPADFAIVGGGLTGLQAALALRQARPTARIVVLERSAFGRGASTRNAGSACFGNPTEMLEDLEQQGATATWDTVARRYAGVRRLQDRYGAHCDYYNHGGYELIENAAVAERVRDALPALNAELKRITGQADVWHPVDGVAGLRSEGLLLRNTLEGQLHPGRLVAHLTECVRRAGVILLNGVTVAEIEGPGPARIQFTGGGELTAERVIVTTNAWSGVALDDAPLHPARNQVLLSEPIAKLPLRGCYHFERGYVYFRNVGPDRILIGGARHLAGPVSDTNVFGPNPEVEDQLVKMIRRWLEPALAEKFRVAQRWSGIIAQGGKSPVVRRNRAGHFVAARLSGMGVALSGTVAAEVAELALAN